MGISRTRKNSIQHDLFGGAVIGVVEGGEIARVEIRWVAGEEGVGGELADDVCHLAPCVHIGSKITVRAI